VQHKAVKHLPNVGEYRCIIKLPAVNCYIHMLMRISELSL
jgi:hypothetical protein